MTPHRIPPRVEINPQQDPLTTPLRHLSRHATEVLDLALTLALETGSRADIAWLLDTQLRELESSIARLRPVLETLKWKDIAA